MKTTVHVKQVIMQSKEQKVVILGKASLITLGNDGPRTIELNCRPAQIPAQRLS